MPSFRVELHSHCQGDPVDKYIGHSIFQHIDRAKEVGLDAIAITWHRGICADEKAFAYGRERGVLVIPGMEADVEGQHHLVVLNLAPGNLPPMPTWAQVRSLRARRPDVLTMAPHPYYPHPTCLGREMEANADCIDAVEWCALHVNWLPKRVNPNLRAARWAQKHGKTLIACSDAHTLKAIGMNASTVEADEFTIPSILTGIREGRVTFHRRALDMGPLIYATGKAMTSQPRHIARWVRKKLGNRSGLPKGTPDMEVQP
jgi:predicted metal-dependent phosphoesterase TrpH